MTYRTKLLWGYTEFQISGDLIVIAEKRSPWQSAVHRFPRSSLSAGSGWIEQRHRGFTSAVQLSGLFAFMVVIFLSIQLELAGWLLWSGMALTVAIMIAAPLFSPIQRIYLAYAASGQPAFAITERRDARGRAEFQAFIEAYQNWHGKKSDNVVSDPTQ